jgi:hypothetical protein
VVRIHVGGGVRQRRLLRTNAVIESPLPSKIKMSGVIYVIM